MKTDEFGNYAGSDATCAALRSEPDLDAYFRKDHALALKFQLEHSVEAYLYRLNIPIDQWNGCIDQIRSVLRNYEPS